MNVRRNRTLTTGMCLALFLTIGVSLGIIYARYVSFMYPSLSVLSLTIHSVAAGMLLANFLWLGYRITLARSPRGSEKPEKVKHAQAAAQITHRPTPFIKRLANYVGCDEQELREPRCQPKSRMTFWSIVDFDSWHGPKPISIIRRILERIRRHVHGP
jgi:hypothetical protein